jgi:hypothetical protein
MQNYFVPYNPLNLRIFLESLNVLYYKDRGSTCGSESEAEEASSQSSSDRNGDQQEDRCGDRGHRDAAAAGGNRGVGISQIQRPRGRHPA